MEWREGRGAQFQAVASLCLYQTDGLSTGPTFADANLQLLSRLLHLYFLMCCDRGGKLFLKSTAAPNKENTRFHCSVKQTRHAGVRNVRHGGILNSIRNKL